jgi:SLOG in TRPM, prokaryote
MKNSLKLTFESGQTALAIRVDQQAELPDALEQIGLSGSHSVLVVVGGASNISEVDFLRIKRLFTEVLAPIAESLGAYVVDGGTDAGVMQLMGEARTQIGAKFALIGVTPKNKVALPNQQKPAADLTTLEPNHTHFVLVPGDKWGDESPWISRVATVLANNAPSLTILLNGGEITFEDAFSSVDTGRLVVVIAGSGRTADILADALRGEGTDERAKKLAKSGILQYVNLIDIEKRVKNLGNIIKDLLSHKE